MIDDPSIRLSILQMAVAESSCTSEILGLAQQFLDFVSGTKPVTIDANSSSSMAIGAAVAADRQIEQTPPYADIEQSAKPHTETEKLISVISHFRVPATTPIGIARQKYPNGGRKWRDHETAALAAALENVETLSISQIEDFTKQFGRSHAAIVMRASQIVSDKRAAVSKVIPFDQIGTGKHSGGFVSGIDAMAPKESSKPAPTPELKQKTTPPKRLFTPNKKIIGGKFLWSPELLERAALELNSGATVGEAANKLSIPYDALYSKARNGRLPGYEHRVDPAISERVRNAMSARH